MCTVQPAPETEEEMYIEIMKYIDRMFNIVRPRQVLYMAIGTEWKLNENQVGVLAAYLLTCMETLQTALRRAPR